MSDCCLTPIWHLSDTVMLFSILFITIIHWLSFIYNKRYNYSIFSNFTKKSSQNIVVFYLLKTGFYLILDFEIDKFSVLSYYAKQADRIPTLCDLFNKIWILHFRIIKKMEQVCIGAHFCTPSKSCSMRGAHFSGARFLCSKKMCSKIGTVFFCEKLLKLGFKKIIFSNPFSGLYK